MSSNTDSPTRNTEEYLNPEALKELWVGRTTEDSQGAFDLKIYSDLTQSDIDITQWQQERIREIQKLTSSERIFFFDAKGHLAKPDNCDYSCSPELGSALFSSDFDGDAIPKASTKVPLQLLKSTLAFGEPVWALDSLQHAENLKLPEDFLEKVRSFAIVPLTVRDHCYGLLYLEHRFQTIQLSQKVAETVICLLHSLAISQAFEKLGTENRSLWGDLLQLNKKLKSLQASDELACFSNPTNKSKAKVELLGDYSMIIGSSPPMIEIFQLLDRIRQSNAPVLINGESGTGKELIANAIHHNSLRKKQNFVSENCAALTETLLESELFGYVKGAFTGANRDHKGLFELADGGTLFLDEVGDMSSNMQKKLLRAVQEGVIRRVGGKDYIRVNVRIISATNKDLLSEVRNGNFREDLYYRLNVINVKLPPLRERKDDIADLIEFFLDQISQEAGISKSVSAQALRLMTQHNWPGNIRELQNEVKRLFALSDQVIEVHNLSENITRGETGATWSAMEEELHSMTLKEAVEMVERNLIKRALLENQANKSQVAKQLQIPKTSLYNKISKYKLDEEIQELLY